LGDSKTITILFGLVLLLVIPLTINDSVFADDDDKKNTTKIIHLGYLQLAAHDFFDMNRATETDNENGKLDLSTVLFNPEAGECDFEKSLKQKDGCALYDDETIANGGEIRSVENIMISTASAEVGEKYLQFVEEDGEQKAYEETVTFYHEQLKKAYEESFHLKFPEPQDGEVTNLHNLALRAGHDFLPGKIVFNGELTSIFLIDPLGEKLSKKEKRQQSSPVDGAFDGAFLPINFCPAPGFCIIGVNLLEVDQNFGEQFAFGTEMDPFDEFMGPNTFNDFMNELEDGKFDKKDKVSKLLKQAFSRGINLVAYADFEEDDEDDDDEDDDDEDDDD